MMRAFDDIMIAKNERKLLPPDDRWKLMQWKSANVSSVYGDKFNSISRLLCVVIPPYTHSYAWDQVDILSKAECKVWGRKNVAAIKMMTMMHKCVLMEKKIQEWKKIKGWAFFGLLNLLYFIFFYISNLLIYFQF